jgi:hypothetical protein
MHPKLPIGTLACLAIAIAISAARAQEQPPDHEHPTHGLIRITRAGVEPAVTRITPDDEVVFLNYSSRIATITFPAGTAEKIRCRTRTSFELIDGLLKAEYVREGTFASLCSFAPGEYAYQVELKTAPGVAESDRMLAGKLVVAAKP